MFNKLRQFVDMLEMQVFKELQDAIKANDLILKNYVIENQLFEQGIDGDGQKLPGYRRTTIRIKISKGQPADRTTLRDSGDFHASIQIKAFSDRFEVESNVPYDEFIIRRYGQKVLKITKENLTEFFNVYFVPNLKRYVDNQITR